MGFTRLQTPITKRYTSVKAQILKNVGSNINKLSRRQTNLGILLREKKVIALMILLLKFYSNVKRVSWMNWKTIGLKNIIALQKDIIKERQGLKIEDLVFSKL